LLLNAQIRRRGGGSRHQEQTDPARRNMVMHVKDNPLKMSKMRSYAHLCLLAAGVVTAVFLHPPVAEALTDTVKMVPQSFHELAGKVSPSVVNIRTEKTVKSDGRAFQHFRRGPQGDDHPFNEFFKKYFGEDFHREFKQRSLGSGFIIDKSGYIVTNNHVIEDADTIKVKLNNESEYEAEIVGRDPNTDLALIKIKSGKNFPSVKLGDSDALKVGEWVVAIGSPFGLEHTVTAGIVSAKGRVIGSGPYDDFIQTDASINPGNSGGPLLNMAGEVVGINTAIIAGGSGIGFAVPINLAKGIIEQLEKKGEVTRGWLGVGIQDITGDMAEYYGLKEGKGVLVADVFKGDPAHEAGIKPQDIILEVNGRKVKTSRELTGLIAGISVGETVKIKVLREGRAKTFKVLISKREDEKISARSQRREYGDELGVQVSNLTEEIMQRFNIRENQGVLVVKVEKGSKAAQAGIRSGDIIREINHTEINTVGNYRKSIGDIEKGETANFFIKRINAGFLVIRLTK